MNVNKCSRCSIALLIVLCASFCSSIRAEDAKIEPASNGILISVSDCFYLYFTKVSFFDKLQKAFPLSTPVKATGNCVTDNTTHPSNIEIEFPFADTKTYTKLLLDLSLTAPDKLTGYWKVDSAKATVYKSTGNIESDLKFEDINSLDKFSYSCSQQNFSGQIEQQSFVIQMNRFQLQGFKGDVFAESFDCSTWFTLSMWMGLLVVLLFLSVISFGITFLVSIQTNDRFEDPRGKPLYIPTSD